jgi:hypothetical protein
LPGRTMARIGLRMMPPFPWPSLKSRTVSFPQYGFKAGVSGRACPSTASSSRRAVCVRPSCTPLPIASYPRSSRGTRCAGTPPCKRSLPLYPRGPRSGPGYSVPIHHHLIGPMRPTRRHIAISPQGGLYAMPSLCVQIATPRRPASGSVLSLLFFVDMSPSKTPESPSVA